MLDGRSRCKWLDILAALISCQTFDEGKFFLVGSDPDRHESTGTFEIRVASDCIGIFKVLVQLLLCMGCHVVDNLLTWVKGLLVLLTFNISQRKAIIMVIEPWRLECHVLVVLWMAHHTSIVSAGASLRLLRRSPLDSRRRSNPRWRSIGSTTWSHHSWLIVEEHVLNLTVRVALELPSGLFSLDSCSAVDRYLAGGWSLTLLLRILLIRRRLLWSLTSLLCRRSLVGQIAVGVVLAGRWLPAFSLLTIGGSKVE